MAKVWGERSLSGEDAVAQSSEFEDVDGIFMASVAIRMNEGSSGNIQRDMPFFGCPRHFTPNSAGTEPHYVEERFEQTDMLPIFAVAIAAQTVQKAFDVIFEAHQPQDTSLKSPTRRVTDQSNPRSLVLCLIP